MNSYKRTINFVVSSRNREAKSAYSISACGTKGFVLDCDPGRHDTNLTAFIEEVMKATGSNLEKFDRLKGIELEIGNISVPPIIINSNLRINESMENLSFDLNELYNSTRSNFSFLLKKVNISQFQGNITGSNLPERSRRVYYNHVVLDCSGHLLSNGAFILRKLINSIKDVRGNLRDFKIILHYIIRIRDILSQEYYNENSSDKRRDILFLCIQKHLNKKLDISSEEFERLDNNALEEGASKDELPPMARLIDGTVLIFNLYNEDEGIKDKLFKGMLEKDLKNVSKDLKRIIPGEFRETCTMRKCKKLLGKRRKPHQRIFDYLTASANEFPKDCLKRIGDTNE